MGLYERNKGKRFEQEVQRKFKEIFPNSRRYGWMQVEIGVADVRAGPFWIECKNQKKPSPIQALLQAESNCPKNFIPLAVCNNGKKKTVTLNLEDFLDFVKEWEERGTIGGLH